MKRRVILDTGPLVAIINGSDKKTKDKLFHYCHRMIDSMI
jgi:hypothetical protein